MITLNPYLNFPGTSEEAFNFYKNVFGGEFRAVMRYGDTSDGEKMPAELRDKITHISLPIGNNVIMATDAMESMGQTLTGGNNNYICVTPDSLEETRRIFEALSAGGEVEMTLEKMFWGAWFASFKDKFGICWMLDFTEKQD
ncbi:VOC family protein [Nostoc ellipsosporum NOK]|nr:VOC family protein [Nostoc ellipsosporum NOK]